MDEAMTGIEVELRTSKGTETVVKILHALHLDAAVTKFQASAIKVVMTVDGREATFPMHSHCVVDCPPGRRKLEVALLGAADVTGLGKRMSHATAEVEVEPGHITMVNFVMGLGVASYALEVAGTRPG